MFCGFWNWKIFSMRSMRVDVIPGTLTGNTKLKLSGRPYQALRFRTRAIKVTNGLHFHFRLTLTVRVILEALLEWHTQHDCHFERGLKGRRILVLLDCNDRLACDANSIGELLLRHLPHGPKFANLIAYSGHQSAFR